MSHRTQNLEYFPLKSWLLKIIPVPGEAKGALANGLGHLVMTQPF